MSKTFDRYFTEGVHNYKIGNIKGALMAFSKCIEISPSTDAYTNRGLMSYMLNNYSSAIDDFHKAIVLDETNIDATFNRGLAFKELDDYERALRDFNTVKSKDKNYPRIDDEIETVKSYQSDKSFRLTLDMVQLDEEPVINIFKRAQSKVASNLHKEAIIDLDEAISLDNSNPDFFYERGICKFHLRDFDGSRLDFQKSFDLGNKQAKYMLDKSVKAVEENKSSFEKARGFISSKKWTEAISELDKTISPFLSGDPEFMFLEKEMVYPVKEVYDAFYYRGYARLQANDFVGSIEDFDWVIGCNPNFGDAFSWRGLAKQHLQDHGGAVEDFSAAIKIAPKQSNYFLSRGINYFNLGNKSKAMEDWAEAIILGNKQGQTLIDRYS